MPSSATAREVMPPAGSPSLAEIAAKFARRVLEQTIRSPNPERSGGALCEAADVIAGEGGIGFVIEGCEIDAVETGYAAFGCYPDIAVAGLKNFMNTVLRETVLCRP